MVRHRKQYSLNSAKARKICNANYILEVVQNPLHGREHSKISDKVGGSSSSLASCHRRYLKPFPVLSLTITLADTNETSSKTPSAQPSVQRHITQYCLEYYFLRISLYNTQTREFEDHKLNNNIVSVGQLTKIPLGSEKFCEFVFEYTDLSINSKGNYRLLFRLHKVETCNAATKIVRLCEVLSEPFEIYSGRKYYSETLKQERKSYMEEVKNKGKASKHSALLASILQDRLVNRCNGSKFQYLNDFGIWVDNVGLTASKKRRREDCSPKKEPVCPKVKREDDNEGFLRREDDYYDIYDNDTNTKRLKSSSSTPSPNSKDELTPWFASDTSSWKSDSSVASLKRKEEFVSDSILTSFIRSEHVPEYSPEFITDFFMDFPLDTPIEFQL